MNVKTIIKSSEVRVIDVPQFEGLAIKDIFAFAQNSPEVERALPPPKEISKLCRGYLANVIYTVMGEPFRQWVAQQINQRNQRIALEGNNMISMDPEIARIFQQSTSISGKFQVCNQHVRCSFEGEVKLSDEGLSLEEKVKSSDRGGEDA